MPDTFENGLGFVKSCFYCVHQTREIYQVLPYLVDIKAPAELWNPLSKTLLNTCNKDVIHVIFLNDRKAQKQLASRTCRYLPNFYTSIW